MKKWLLALLTLSVILTGCTQAEPANKDESPVVVEEKEYAVQVATVGNESFVEAVELSGVLSPVDEAYVSAKTGGEIESILGQLGDQVTAEEVLMTLEDEAYRLAKSKASLGVENANATYKNVLTTYKRSKELYDSGGLSQTELDQLKLQLDMAELGLRNSRVDLESAQLNYDYTKIVAPINGLIAERSGSVGENISPGQSLFRIVDISSFYVELGVSENLISKIFVGQKVQCNSSDGKVIEGIVENVSPVMEMQSKTYPAKIKIENKDSSLRSGMSVTAIVELKSAYSALSVPKEAVILMGDKRYVFVVEGDRAKQREVKVLSTNDKAFEIVSGVSAGEQVVVSGPSLLKDNDKIKLKE